MIKKQLYTLKAWSPTVRIEFYVADANKEKALAAGKAEYPFLAISIYEEMGEVVVAR